MIRVREKPHHDIDDNVGIHNHHDNDEKAETSYYFYIKSELDSTGNQQVQMIEDLDHIVDFIINDDYIFIWTKKEVKYFKLSCNFALDHGHVIDLKIAKEDSHIQIVEVRVGSDSN